MSDTNSEERRRNPTSRLSQSGFDHHNNLNLPNSASASVSPTTTYRLSNDPHLKIYGNNKSKVRTSRHVSSGSTSSILSITSPHPESSNGTSNQSSPYLTWVQASPHMPSPREKPDPKQWAAKMDLREKAHFSLQEFSGLAKEASSSQEISEDILRVAKAFTQLETNIKNTANILTRMKTSVADVHQSNEGILEALKTLPSIADGLAIEDLVKPLTPANTTTSTNSSSTSHPNALKPPPY